MTQSSEQNVWFGVAMFLLGLIVGAILSMTQARTLQQPVAQVPSPSAPAPAQQVAPVTDVKSEILGIVKSIGLDEGKFSSCYESKSFDALIEKQQQGGMDAGVRGTPATLLVSPKAKTARFISGAQQYDSFKKNVDEMLKDPRSKPSDSTVTMVEKFESVSEKDHIKGSLSAPLILVEYSDYECPFCRAVHPTLQKVVSEYGGKVSWVVRHYPLNFHPKAKPYAVGAECAASLGGADAFWKYTDAIMAK